MSVSIQIRLEVPIWVQNAYMLTKFLSRLQKMYVTGTVLLGIFTHDKLIYLYWFESRSILISISPYLIAC